jgi:hypothetical protein
VPPYIAMRSNSARWTSGRLALTVLRPNSSVSIAENGEQADRPARARDHRPVGRTGTPRSRRVLRSTRVSGPSTGLSVAAGAALVASAALVLLGLTVIGGADQDTTSASIVTVAQLPAETCSITGPVRHLTVAEAANADAIVSSSMAASNESSRAARIALMTAMTESGLQDLDSRGPGLARAVPRSAPRRVGGPRPRSWTRPTPPMRSSPALSVPHWQQIAPWLAAEHVQHSADPMGPTTNRTGYLPARSSPRSSPMATPREPAGKAPAGTRRQRDGHGLPSGVRRSGGHTTKARRGRQLRPRAARKAVCVGRRRAGAYDCSGLTMAAWASVGVALAHASSVQQTEGVAVTAAQLVPGDLVLVPGSDSPGPGLAGHVGIYLGDGLVRLCHRHPVRRRRPDLGHLRLWRLDRTSRSGPRRVTAANQQRKRSQAMNVSPNTTGLPGISELENIVGALLTIALIASLAGLVISAIVWAIGNHSVNPVLAGRGKTGVLVAFVAAALTGGAVTLINFFFGAGSHL